MINLLCSRFRYPKENAIFSVNPNLNLYIKYIIGRVFVSTVIVLCKKTQKKKVIIKRRTRGVDPNFNYKDFLWVLRKGSNLVMMT